ncbi:hypothetical protein [Flavobacterium oreochromis]|uniref:hypothetical protein n=1 Tax=Flavobacterium oreochromis TaxID=2906078 RepID=UPI00385BEEF4
MIDISTLKNWFKKGLKPTQEQFWEWMDSYWHKKEKIPIEKIEGIDPILQTINTLNERNHLIIKTRELQIFKVAPNSNNNILEIGDFVQGIVEGQFINATYNGGDSTKLTSYGIYN